MELCIDVPVAVGARCFAIELNPSGVKVKRACGFCGGTGLAVGKDGTTIGCPKRDCIDGIVETNEPPIWRVMSEDDDDSCSFLKVHGYRITEVMDGSRNLDVVIQDASGETWDECNNDIHDIFPTVEAAQAEADRRNALREVPK